MENSEIFKCSSFIFDRIEKEIDLIDSDFYSELMLNQEKYEDLLFFQFKTILLREGDPVIRDEYIFVMRRIITAFKDLKEFQKKQFNINEKDKITYTKFYKEIFNIIIYITNLVPVEDYKFDIKTIYPTYLTYKKLQQLLPIDLIMNKGEIDPTIQPKEIIEMFRGFLLFIISRSFLFIYYNLNEFIPVFLGEDFRHDKYIGLIAQQKLDLLYDIVHKPNINKIFNNYWYEMQFQDRDLYRFNNNNMKGILNFGLFLKEINYLNSYILLNFLICNLYLYLLLR